MGSGSGASTRRGASFVSVWSHFAPLTVEKIGGSLFGDVRTSQ